MKLSPAMREALHRLGDATRLNVRTFVKPNGHERSVVTGATGRALRALQRRGLAVAEAGNPSLTGPRGHYVNWRLTPEGHRLLLERGGA